MDIRQELLRSIRLIEEEKAQTRREQIRKSETVFKDELQKVTRWKNAAKKRMKAQSAAGEYHSANLSRKAYDYCEDYALKLKRILEGLEAQKAGKIQTKDGNINNRFYAAETRQDSGITSSYAE